VKKNVENKKKVPKLNCNKIIHLVQKNVNLKSPKNTLICLPFPRPLPL